MRIIGGHSRGRKLRAPPGRQTRPTADRVRESLFNILGSPDGDVLDLFAGAGTLGLEALSRGANAAVFVDMAGPAIRCVRANLETLGAADRAVVERSDALAAVRRLGGQGRRFCWVFADPPYAFAGCDELIEAVGAARLLADGGRLVIEHDRRTALPTAAGGLARTDQRRYGDTALSFYTTAPGELCKSPGHE